MQQQHKTSLDQLHVQQKCSVSGEINGICLLLPVFTPQEFPLSIRLGEPPPVSLLSWSRGGLVNGPHNQTTPDLGHQNLWPVGWSAQDMLVKAGPESGVLWPIYRGIW